jgi:hypothetical protein
MLIKSRRAFSTTGAVPILQWNVRGTGLAEAIKLIYRRFLRVKSMGTVQEI